MRCAQADGWDMDTLLQTQTGDKDTRVEGDRAASATAPAELARKPLDVLLARSQACRDEIPMSKMSSKEKESPTGPCRGEMAGRGEMCIFTSKPFAEASWEGKGPHHSTTPHLPG